MQTPEYFYPWLHQHYTNPSVGSGSQGKNKICIPKQGGLAKNLCKGFEFILAQSDPECYVPKIYTSFILLNLNASLS